MRILGFGEGIIQKFDKLLLEYPADGSQYITWNISNQTFDSSKYDNEKLNTTLTKEELDLILKDIKSSLILKMFKNYEYNERKFLDIFNISLSIYKLSLLIICINSCIFWSLLN